MYIQFYGLSERPFSNVPDTTFLFKSRQYLDAYNQLLYGVHAKQGFMALVGDVGTGKTTLCRSLLHALEGQMETALIFNPPDTATALLKTILQDLGQQPSGASKKELLDSLNTCLLQSSARGRGVVIIIDEAQNLSSEVLEEIRLLSNLETEKEKLLQIILSGQPELLKKLSKTTLRQLYQRIAIWAYLKPLTRTDVSHYIYHRLVKAGSNGSITFTRRSLDKISHSSGGLPRTINLICDKALLAGYVAQKKNITGRMVQEAINNSSVERVPAVSMRVNAVYTLTLGIIISALFLGMLAPLKLDIPQRWIGQFTGDARAGVHYARAKLPDALLAAAPKPAAAAVPVLETIVKQVSVPRSGVFDSDGVLRQDRVSECAPEALATLLVLWDVPQEQLMQELQKRSTSASFSFSDVAQIFGLAVTPLDTTLEQIKRLDYPCIIPVSDPGYRYVVLAGIKNDQAILLDPRHGRVSLALEKLHEQWTGKAFYVWQEFMSLPPRLQRGDVHQQVILLKETLNANNFSLQEPFTDVFDSQMEKAVKALQTQYGLKIDGIIGCNTRMAFYRMGYGDQVPHLEM
jgi:general secretion pathway protein A